MVQKLLTAIQEQMENLIPVGIHAGRRCVRPGQGSTFAGWSSSHFPMLTVLSYAEIAPDTNLDSIGMVTFNDEN